MKKILFSLFIVLFRILDLYTTYVPNDKFLKEEQNLIVKLFKLNIHTFFFIEIIFAFIAACIFYWAYDKVFLIKAKTFSEYLNLYFINKVNPSLSDWLFKISYKRTIILFGKVLFLQISITSTIFAINNIWVNYIDQNYYTNDKIVSLYYTLNNFYFFDFIIFFLPILLLILLIYKELRTNYLLNTSTINL